MNNTTSEYYNDSWMFHGSLPWIMGTRFDLILIGKNRDESENIWKIIKNELANLDHMLNRFDPESEISMINKNAKHQSTIISTEMWQILQDCRQYHQKTYGLFDITLTDLSQVLFFEREQTVTFLQPSLSLDFGGYAKGYTMKKLVKILKAHEVENCFVDFGNSAIFALGHHPYGDSWKVSIENPFNKKEIIAEFELRNSALSTSGNTPHYSGHIVNPLSSKRIDDKRLICIECEDPVDAEVISTTLIAADKKQKKWILSQFEVKQIVEYNL